MSLGDDCTNPCWETLMSPCREHAPWGKRQPRLRKALLTTFDPPDPMLLIEDLLPVWLGLNHQDVGDTNRDRYLFYGELHEALNRIRNRISIFHSYRPTTPPPSWLWRQVRLFPVGCNGPAVQHAKLWALHWTVEEDGVATGYLEILISSCNLTRSGFRGQLQAAWRAIIPIADRGTRANAEKWGVLPGFLEALGRSAGTDGEAAAAQWIAMLARTQCPAEADFVASVPGGHPMSALRRSATAWGAAGIRNIDLGQSGNVGVEVLVPTVGTWDDKTWSNWVTHSGVSDGGVSLAWVDGNHPWRKDWVLPKESAQTFAQYAVSFREIPGPGAQAEPWLHDRHVPQDPRWCHAKAYWFRRGRHRKVLITSANLSPSAWGFPSSGGGLRIENFELGVAVPCTDRPIDRLLILEEPYAADAVSDDAKEIFGWSVAAWDGQHLRVQCRLVAAEYRLDATAKILLLARGEQQPRVDLTWTGSSPSEAVVPWDGTSGVPIFIQVAAAPIESGDAHFCEVPVSDLRPEDQAAATPCPEIPEHDRHAVEMALLLERYGCGDAEDALGAIAGSGIVDVAPEGGPADYEVAVIEQSRRNWEVVDGWAAEFGQAAGTHRDYLLHDGRRLRDYWRQMATNAALDAVGVAAGLAADELDLRLED